MIKIVLRNSKTKGNFKVWNELLNKTDSIEEKVKENPPTASNAFGHVALVTVFI